MGCQGHGHVFTPGVGTTVGGSGFKFTNTLGESIQVEVCPTPDETSKLLSRVLTGNQNAADILARLVHFDAKPDFEDVDNIPDDSQ